MKCRNCGEELRDGAKFCRYCGSENLQQPVVKGSTRTENKTAYDNQFSDQYGVVKKSVKLGRKKLPIILASVAGVIVAVAVIITVLLINNSHNSEFYKKAFKVYKDELQQAKEEIDSYADSKNIADNDRDLISVCDVFKKKTPSLVYVVGGKDTNDNEIPVIRICDMKDDEARIIYESYVEYSPVERISLLKNSDTGEVYLFSDTESPESGNVVIYSLYKENDEVKQDEKYRLTYELNDDNNKEYDYIYYIDKDSVDEEKYNTVIKSFVDSIDTVIVSDNTASDGLKFDYFKDIASVAMSYDEAIEYLDKGISGATLDEIVSKKDNDDAVRPTEVPKVYDVDPADLPDGLTEFLEQFDFAYFIDSYGKKEFDYKNLDECYDYLVNRIVGNPPCVNNSLYPYGKVNSYWEGNVDPLGKYDNWGTLEYPKKKLMWILENIFHVSEKDANDMLQAAFEADSDFYEYEKDGEMYLYQKIGGVGGPGFEAVYETVRFDGERYYIIYDCVSPFYNKDDEPYVYYAEMAQEEIDGETYWTMYKHTDDIPELPESNIGELSDSDIFSMFEGGYTFTSGAGFWSTQLQLNSDGTFTGEYHDTDMGVRGEGYDATVYYSKFSGHFFNPKKINAYTYSFEISDIEYENEPDTEEIGNPYDNGSTANMLIKYTTAYGLDRGSKTVYAYTPSAPVPMLPEGFMSWVGHLRDRETRNKSALSYKSLYVVETEYGWIGHKE